MIDEAHGDCDSDDSDDSDDNFSVGHMLRSDFDLLVVRPSEPLHKRSSNSLGSGITIPLTIERDVEAEKNRGRVLLFACLLLLAVCADLLGDHGLGWREGRATAGSVTVPEYVTDEEDWGRIWKAAAAEEDEEVVMKLNALRAKKGAGKHDAGTVSASNGHGGHEQNPEQQSELQYPGGETEKMAAFFDAKARHRASGSGDEGREAPHAETASTATGHGGHQYNPEQQSRQQQPGGEIGKTNAFFEVKARLRNKIDGEKEGEIEAVQNEPSYRDSDAASFLTLENYRKKEVDLNAAAEPSYTDAALSLTAESFRKEELQLEEDRAKAIEVAWDEVEAHTLRFGNFSDVTEPYFDDGTDTALFWHVPKSAGTTIQDILLRCVGLVEASEVGISEGHGDDSQLAVIPLLDGGRYVNVDTTTKDGLERAGQMGFAKSGLADVAFTSYLLEANNIFDASEGCRARCFTLLRHPIKRAVSMFYYLQFSSWELTYDDRFQNMTIEQYAAGGLSENNWMIRMLTGYMSGPMDWTHLEKAKAVLKRKCIVGLLDEFDAALDRFQRYFGWTDRVSISQNSKDCEESLLHDGGDNKHPHPKHEEGSEVWELFLKKNEYDLMLYEFAKELIEDQKELIQDLR